MRTNKKTLIYSVTYIGTALLLIAFSGQSPGAALPLGTAFNYSGELQPGGIPVSAPTRDARASGECFVDADCDEGQVCQDGLCLPGLCVPGEACEDGDPCTVDDTCNADGGCVGGPVVCVDLSVEDVRVCSLGDDRFQVVVETGGVHSDTVFDIEADWNIDIGGPLSDAATDKQVLRFLWIAAQTAACRSSGNCLATCLPPNVVFTKAGGGETEATNITPKCKSVSNRCYCAVTATPAAKEKNKHDGNKGDYTITVTMDPDNVIQETDESNNSLTVVLAEGAPECPTGACCELDASCTDGTTASGCAALKGTYQGDDTFCPEACDLAPCEPGDGCDDGDACTFKDTCLDNGECVGQLDDCDDGDPCTNDSCDSAVGCSSTPIPCPDGQTCREGKCVPAGACCGVGEDGCVDASTVFECFAAGGSYRGDGSICAEVRPVILEQPKSTAVCKGSSVVLSVLAGGLPPLSYQWFHDGQPIDVKGPELTLELATNDDAGNYRVIVSNDCGILLSEFARLFVYGANELPPVIVAPQRVPERWQAEDVQWIGDVAPHNKIDDRIDAGGPGPFDIIVNFKVEVGPIQTAAASAVGTIQHIGRYVTSVFVGGVNGPDVQTIAARDDVAFIELQTLPVLFLDVATQASKVTAGFYTPDTVEDFDPTLDGSGVNIAIFDTGVDDPDPNAPGTTNQGLPAAVFFYDCAIDFLPPGSPLPQTFTNPDDMHGHGTHVAGIALGRGVGTVHHGVAPAAGLIDVSGIATGATVPEIFKGLDILITKRLAWNLGVINMSFGFPTPSDGQDTFSQNVDTAVGLGIVVVAAAGNDGPGNSGFGTPAAATDAITVANAEDQGTPDRSGDTLRNSSSRGPRHDDGDLNCLDELKPEITAHGTTIRSTLFDSSTGGQNRTGTSMSSPHIAGIAALLLQANPVLTPGAVKQAMISTAEHRGAPSAIGCDPDWNNGWGWGIVDAHAAVTSALGVGPPMSPLPTDLGFETFTGPVYANTKIETTAPPQVGVPNTLRALVQNFGPNDAINLQVKFKIDYISASSGSFYDVGTVTVPLILAGGLQFVSIAWTPQHPNHQCLKAAINYAADTASNNNNAQRNITVALSPVFFRVENLIAEELIEIQFVPTFDPPDSGWGIQFTPPSVFLEGGEFAMIEALPLPPFGAPDGEQVTIFVSATHDGCLLGGVAIIATMTDCDGNGVDDFIDIRDGTHSDKNDNGVPDLCDCNPACVWDIDSSGEVRVPDLIKLLSCWGPLTGDPICACLDIDGTGDIRVPDLIAMLAEWGLCP